MAEIRINGKKIGLVNGKKVRAIHYGLKTFYPTYEEESDTLEISITAESGISSFSFMLASTTGANEEITVDWGNGRQTTAVATTRGTWFTNPITYTRGDYVIKMPATENYKITNYSPSNYYLWGSFKKLSFKYWRIPLEKLFKDNTLLESANLGVVSEQIGIKYINNNIFNGCTKLKYVNIPDKIIVIYELAFYKCTNLKTITMLSTTPPSLTLNALEGCSALVEIKVPASAVETYKSATNWSAYADYIVGY